jgi:hypothetical protein
MPHYFPFDPNPRRPSRPHTVSTRQPPNEADLLELLYRVVPDERTLNRILVDNPAGLFGFGP